METQTRSFAYSTEPLPPLFSRSPPPRHHQPRSENGKARWGGHRPDPHDCLVMSRVAVVSITDHIREASIVPDAASVGFCELRGKKRLQVDPRCGRPVPQTGSPRSAEPSLPSLLTAKHRKRARFVRANRM